MEKVYKLQPIPTANTYYGGKLIQKKFGMGLDLPNVAEMYNVIAIPNHLDNIVEGTGKHLSEFYHENRDFFGDCKSKDFPVRSMMCCYTGKGSVHLHPKDDYGLAHDGMRGKIESVVVRGNGSDSHYVGHTAKTKEEFIKMVNEKRWKDLLIERTIKNGDFYIYDYGQLHGDSHDYEGDEDGLIASCWCTNGDLSYRLWDHDRPADPKRPLHLDKVLDCVKIPDTDFDVRHVEAETVNGLEVKHYYSKPGVFEAYDVVCKEKGTFELKEFACYTCFDGEGTVAGFPIKGGETLMVCADFGPLEIEGNVSLSVISYKD